MCEYSGQCRMQCIWSVFVLTGASSRRDSEYLHVCNAQVIIQVLKLSAGIEAGPTLATVLDLYKRRHRASRDGKSLFHSCEHPLNNGSTRTSNA